jgi:hypothetical protein
MVGKQTVKVKLGEAARKTKPRHIFLREKSHLKIQRKSPSKTEGLLGEDGLA